MFLLKTNATSLFFLSALSLFSSCKTRPEEKAQAQHSEETQTQAQTQNTPRGPQEGALQTQLTLESLALKDKINSFQNIESCMAQYASFKNDPALSQIFSGLSYPHLFKDTCLSLHAFHFFETPQSNQSCEQISSSSLKEQCLSFLASLRKKPEECPLVIASEPKYGHDLLCLAMSMRDFKYCHIFSSAREEKSCIALLKSDPSFCDQSIPSLYAECKENTLRLSHLFSPDPHAKTSVNDTFLSKVQIDLSAEGDTEALPPVLEKSSILHESKQGVLKIQNEETLGPEYSFGSPHLEHSGMISYGPQKGLSLSLRWHFDKSKKTILDSCSLGISGRVKLQSLLVANTLQLHVVHKPKESFGSPVHLLLEGDIGVSPQHYKIKAEISTFLRDELPVQTLK